MSLDRLLKLRIVCHGSMRSKLLSAIESTGKVHVCEANDAPEMQDWLHPAEEDTSALRDQIESLTHAIDFLRSFAPAKTLREKLTEVPPMMDPESLDRHLHDRELLWKAERAWRIAVVIEERKGDLHELTQEIAFLEPWSGLDLPVDEIRDSASFSIWAGVVQPEGAAKLAELKAACPLCAVSSLGRSPLGERVVIACHSSAVEEARQAVSAAGFAACDFGGRKGLARDLLKAAKMRASALRHRISALEKEARRLSGDLGLFEILLDAAGLRLATIDAISSGRSGDRLFVLSGWVREKHLALVRKAVESPVEALLETVEPEEGEEPPAALSETAVVDPYTMLTDMFGRPSGGDPDPTPLIAPFYAVFFGICIGDAGYGAVVALATLVGMLLLRRKGVTNRLLGMLFQGGLSAIVMGTLLGAYFGIRSSLLPPILLEPSKLLQSLVAHGENVRFGLSREFLYTTMALGIFQLFSGFVVNFVKRWRKGERLTAVLEQSGWLLAGAGMFPWLFNHYLLNGILYDVNGPLDKVFLYCLLAGGVLIFLMGGREARGFGKFGLGAMAAYGIVNLLADALSYSRLFALSLSGGIIATVVNDIAGMLPGTHVPILGLFIAVPVILFGHIFNIFMCLLGGFIHTARLQFVEFFGKFYEGTGTPFAPLKYNPQFVNIIRRKSGRE